MADQEGQLPAFLRFPLVEPFRRDQAPAMLEGVAVGGFGADRFGAGGEARSSQFRFTELDKSSVRCSMKSRRS